MAAAWGHHHDDEPPPTPRPEPTPEWYRQMRTVPAWRARREFAAAAARVAAVQREIWQRRQDRWMWVAIVLLAVGFMTAVIAWR